MSARKPANKNILYKLKRTSSRCGFDSWRYYFNGVSPQNGEQVCFFIELLIENPAVAADEIKLFQKHNTRLAPEDLQNALTGSLSQPDSSSQTDSIPSFAAVRVGIFGKKSKQINRFFPASEFKSQKKIFSIQLGGCVFTENELYGSIAFTKEDLREHPEFMSDVGRMEWNLHYETQHEFSECYGNKKEDTHYIPTGVTSKFSGRVLFDGSEYVVSPEMCFGYSDKNWGKSFPVPFFHLNCSQLSSVFTGKIMQDSGFAVQGNYNGKLCVMCIFEKQFYSFGIKKQFKKYEFTSNCIQVPENDGEPELHWTASFHNKKYVLDVDVYCASSGMLVRDYEIPEGKRKVLKILTGGKGSGEIRLYKKQKRSLEILEHANLENVVCEYGQIEDIE